MEKNKRNTIVLQAFGVQEATEIIEEYENDGYVLIGTPTDFGGNSKILFTMKKQDPDALKNMMDNVMKNMKK